MKLENEKDIIQLVMNDQQMMDILKTASTLELPDWWICAGFVRSKIWDTLHGFQKRTALGDVDLIYFDNLNINETDEKRLEKLLFEVMPEVPWSVKNQARMHLKNNLNPYTSSTDAISKFTETATALGVKLDQTGNILLTAPHGIDDVLQLIVRPTPLFRDSAELLKIYNKRLAEKNWSNTWHMLTFKNK